MVTDKDNLLDDLQRNDDLINNALDEIGVPRDNGLAIYSTWGRVSWVLLKLARLEAAEQERAADVVSPAEEKEYLAEMNKVANELLG